jgi:hypothetical protein
MNNKQLFLIPLLLFIPAATQCMEEITVTTCSEPLTIQKFKIERQKIHDAFDFVRQCDIYGHPANCKWLGIPEEPKGPILTCGGMRCVGKPKSLLLSYIYFCNYKLASEQPHPKRFTINYFWGNTRLLTECRDANTHMPFFTTLQPEILCYSALGIAAATPNLSLSEKKDMIQQLFELDFKQRFDDKKIVILELWDRREIIIKQLLPFKDIINNQMSSLLGMNIPAELVDYIYQLLSLLTIKKELLF